MGGVALVDEDAEDWDSVGRIGVGTATRAGIGRGVEEEEGVGVPRSGRETEVDESESDDGGGESSEGEERIRTTRGTEFLFPPGPHRPSSTSSSVVSDVEGELETFGETGEAIDASEAIETSASLSNGATTKTTSAIWRVASAGRASRSTDWEMKLSPACGSD